MTGSVVSALTVEARLKRRIREHLRKLGFQRSKNGELVLANTSKEALRTLHAPHRSERLRIARSFINEQWANQSVHFADGTEVEPTSIRPRLELVLSRTPQADLFRLATLTWSIPVSSGYGRRMRFLVWDDNNGKLIGLFGLTDPVFNLAARDTMVGWDASERKKQLLHVMDAHVLGAVPPYSQLLGGKLVASLVCSSDVRRLFARKYANRVGVISGKTRSAKLVMITTSSALGRSSIYNRLRLTGQRLFEPIGYTAGWGHFHIPDRLFDDMREFMVATGRGYACGSEFGDGPNWRFRVAKDAMRALGMNPDLMRHGVTRELFAASLATNATAILKGTCKRPNYRGQCTASEIASACLERWILPRSHRKPEFREWQRDNLWNLLIPQSAHDKVKACPHPGR